MIIWKDETMLLDTDTYKLNIGIADFIDLTLSTVTLLQWIL